MTVAVHVLAVGVAVRGSAGVPRRGRLHGGGLHQMNAMVLARAIGDAPSGAIADRPRCVGGALSGGIRAVIGYGDATSTVMTVPVNRDGLRSGWNSAPIIGFCG